MYAVTGADGQLGRCLRERLLGDTSAIFVDICGLDITDESAVKKFFKTYKIDTVINCAAYTAVDAAEDDAMNADAVNNYGAGLLAKYGRRIIHVSTDYVFDGFADMPYGEDEAPSPLSVYGITKLAGEVSVLRNAETAAVIRTSWLYSEHGNNFVKTMQRLGAEKPQISVVSDQVGTPTYAGDLADAILKVAAAMPDGTREIYNYSNMGSCSWYGFACMIMEMLKLDCFVKPIESKDYPQKAPRPHYSVLDKSKIISQYDVAVPYWSDSLLKCITRKKHR
ncbi:MAG: dTDP-4-dehydrorhamnose reductase [Alphaproteobacteria bacterium]|nr:dTDP-4-dehydrorhamnose reductase [Alphaproteobacteria bacterium]